MYECGCLYLHITVCLGCQLQGRKPAWNPLKSHCRVEIFLSITAIYVSPLHLCSQVLQLVCAAMLCFCSQVVTTSKLRIFEARHHRSPVGIAPAVSSQWTQNSASLCQWWAPDQKNRHPLDRQVATVISVWETEPCRAGMLQDPGDLPLFHVTVTATRERLSLLLVS